MDYQNADEAVRREVIEKVKQIVKAIKTIKIKYYANFVRISEKDQETYQILTKELDQISSKHKLDNLKIALMEEVSQKYDIKSEDDIKKEKQEDPEDILKACYGAIDAQKEALSRGKISQALRGQEMLEKYINQIDNLKVLNEIKNYKRKKFAELVRSREDIENKNKDYMEILKECFNETNSQERTDVIEVVNNCINDEKNISKEEASVR